MRLLVSLFGLFVMLLGAGYIYRPEKVSKFNSWCRNNLFSDRLLITSRRKTGVLLLFAGMIILLFLLRR